MFKNKLKQDLFAGKVCFGTFLINNSPDIVEMCGHTGFDFIIIDNEHGYMSPESSIGLIRAAEVSGMTPIIRVPENSEAVILKSLDIGAYGIQVPQINDASAAELVVKRAKYFPQGMRGVAMARSANYGTVPLFDYLEQENRETLVSVHCENITGLQNLDAIAATPGVDIIFLGPFDMSQSMGIPGQVEHPRIYDAMEQVVAACKKHGKIAGTFCTTPQIARDRAKQGFQFLALGTDASLISTAFKEAIDIARG